MRNLEFKNREKKPITAILKEVENSKGTVILMHGVNDTKEREYILKIQDAFVDSGYTTLNFDPIERKDLILENGLKDLEDTIDWARNQDFFKEELILSGHSAGGWSVCTYAKKHPSLVSKLILIAPFVSLLYSIKHYRRRKKKIKLINLINLFKYNLNFGARKLKMDVLIIVGEEDWTTPKEGARKLFKLIKGRKEYREVKNARHVYNKKEEMEEIYLCIREFLKK